MFFYVGLDGQVPCCDTVYFAVAILEHRVQRLHVKRHYIMRGPVGRRLSRASIWSPAAINTNMTIDPESTKSRIGLQYNIHGLCSGNLSQHRPIPGSQTCQKNLLAPVRAIGRISTPLTANDIANPSELKLLERLLPQSLGRLLVLRGVTIGSKRLNVPAHQEAAVALCTLDDGGVDISGSTRDLLAPGQGANQLGGHSPRPGLLAAEFSALDEARVGQVDYHIRRRHVLDQLPEEEVRQELGGAVLFCGVEL